MVYENVIKVRGPYLSKQDGRLRIWLVFNDKTTKGMSYPKYLMELHLDRYLEDNETVDHIDGNPLNNELSNLRVLDRTEHCTNDVIRNHDITVSCKYCGKEFTIPGNKIQNRNRKDRHQSGYFCSKSCSGKYGKMIQLGKMNHVVEEKVKPLKFQLHEI